MKSRKIKPSTPAQARDAAWLVAEIGAVKQTEVQLTPLCLALKNEEAVRCGKALMKLVSHEGSALPSRIVPPQL
jgi:hypothetical protein